MADEVRTIPFDPDTADLSGLTVIEASAGTGKTHAIQKMVRRLVLEGVPMSRMLVMSYTNAAAAELSERIRRELQQSLERCPAEDLRRRLPLQQALADFDRACISTIHAFCQRMLQEHPMEAGVHGVQGWSLQTDETEARRRACGDAWAAIVAPDPLLAGMVSGFESVQEGLGAALGRRAERDRVQSADFHASCAEAEEALRAIGKGEAAIKLAAIESSFKADAKGPASLLLTAAQAGGLPGEAERKACADLLDDRTMQASVPAAAAKAATARAILASAGWTALRRSLERLRDATEGLEQAAIDTVVRDALARLLVHRARTRTLVFDDLITRLRDAVMDPSGAMVGALRDRFDTVVVDEVQDTDPVQAGILQRAFAESPTHRLILVGDPKQSIYAFRNADVDSYMAIRGLCRKPWYRLDVSWRSDPALIEGVQALYAVERPFLRDDMPPMEVRSAHPGPRMHGSAGHPPGLAVHVTDSVVADDMLDLTAHAIAADLRAGWMIDEEQGGRRSIRPGDVAVLCHQHHQGRRVADGLRRLGVPVIVMDQQQVWQMPAAKAVLQLLAAMARPWDRASALGALAGPCTGLRAKGAVERPDEWVQALRAAADAAARHGIGAALRQLVTQGVPAEGRAGMLKLAEGERLATDFDHVVEELERAQVAGAGTVHALAGWLARRVHGQASGEQALCRSLGGVDAVQVMTLHGSKGLTFGVTWLPTFMVPSKRERDAAEARRLLYVGLTRARFVTRVVWMPSPEAASSPLAHLLHARAADSIEAAMEVARERLQTADALRDLDALAAGNTGSVAVLPLDPGPLPPATARAPARLGRSRPMPQVPERAVLLSFTSLSSVKKGAEGDREERDVDAAAPRDGPREAVTPMDEALRQAGPTGAALGTLVHDALAEPQAFASLRSGAGPDALHAALVRHAVGLRVKSEASLLTLADALRRALAAPSGDPLIPTVAECASAPDRCLRELDVALPWRGSPAALAEILRAERAPWSDRVATVLAAGAAEESLGSLVGNLDLAVERDGQWFIYDYKTNFVGDDASAYAPDALHQAMAAELYPLQAALYSVMLTRWLATRGWRTAGRPVIGGVAYLFLRGMDPDRGPQGSWTWHPSTTLLERLDAILPPVRAEVTA